MTNLSIIGGGEIGEALVAGLVHAGVDPSTVTVSNRRKERSEYFTEHYGVRATLDNSRAAAHADIIFVCVKPGIVGPVLEEMAEAISDADHSPLIVSFAAGVTLQTMADALSAGAPIARVMPNTPMKYNKGVFAVTPGRFVQDSQLEELTKELNNVGRVVIVAEEEMDAATAMSGSGPGYIFLVAEAMIDAGVNQGLPRKKAEELVCTAIEGAGTMLAAGEHSPTELREQICTPKGTTSAAVRELEESGLRGAFFRAVEACVERAGEFGMSDSSRADASGDD